MKCYDCVKTIVGKKYDTLISVGPCGLTNYYRDEWVNLCKKCSDKRDNQEQEYKEKDRIRKLVDQELAVSEEQKKMYIRHSKERNELWNKIALKHGYKKKWMY